MSRVLVVISNKRRRASLKRLLEDNGFTVETAEDEEQARRKLRAGQFDFIFGPAGIAAPPEETVAAKEGWRAATEEESIRHRLAKLEAINKISGALRNAQNVDEALPILLDETLTTLDLPAGAIWLYDSARGLLQVAVTRGWFQQFPEKPLRPGEGIAGTVFATGEPHISTEFARDPLARLPSPLQEIPEGWGGACLPIPAAQNIAGVMFVSCKLPRQITAEELQLLSALTDIASTTLQRMQAHAEMERQVAHLQAIRTIDLAIMSSVDMRLTLEVLLDQVVEQLQVDAAGVLLLDPHLHRLEFTAGRGFSTNAYEKARLRVDLGESVAGEVTRQRRTIQNTERTPKDLPESFVAMLRAEGFVYFAVTPLIAKGKPKGVLEVYSRSHLEPDTSWLEFLETLATQAAIAVDNAQLFENLQRSNTNLRLAYDAIIEGWARATEIKGQEPQGHSRRVAALTIQVGRIMGVATDRLIHMRHGALLHDIGNLGIPDSILLKSGPLTEEEWELIQQHPQRAYDLLHPIAYLRPALEIPLHHHERWDGSGYPEGLQGDQIPLAARIFAVIDVWDVLTSDRPYRAAWPRDKALKYIQEHSGSQFDPQVVKSFVQIAEAPL